MDGCPGFTLFALWRQREDGGSEVLKNGAEDIIHNGKKFDRNALRCVALTMIAEYTATRMHFRLLRNQLPIHGRYGLLGERYDRAMIYITCG